ncbi:MAG: phosphotransferase [Planctomycetes bacterium]|nr:phosphotransferase [Planctomycetota bacterium]
MTDHHLARQVRAIARRFAIEGELTDLALLRRGHIHGTWISTFASGTTTRRYVHQLLNQGVFPDLEVLMSNVARVCDHLRDLADQGRADGLRPLELIATRDGATWLETPEAAWRTYRFVEGTVSRDKPASALQARRAARAFGIFQRLLAELPEDALQPTIPHFFDGLHRLEALDRAIAADRLGRAGDSRPEIEFILERRPLFERFAAAIADGRLPRRYVHGDTKLNNLLFDAKTGEPVCVVDLDTCMPAWSLFDYGDLVRFTAARSAEDEPDPSRAGIDSRIHHALTEGFCEGRGETLLPLERAWMSDSARLVTLILAARFLCDHLDGDRYFATSRPDHNLDRARVQIAQVADLER